MSRVIITAPVPVNAPEGYSGYSGYYGPFQFAGGSCVLKEGEVISPWVYGQLVRHGFRVEGQDPPAGFRVNGDPAHDKIAAPVVEPEKPADAPDDKGKGKGKAKSE